MTMDGDDLCLFALGASRPFGERTAAALGTSLDPLEERSFADGEHKTRPMVNVRGRDVFVLHSLYADRDASVNDKLCRLLFFLGACRDAGAGRVTAVVPYLCYARKDRKTKARDPVTTRYVAGLFESLGVDAVVTMDVHNLAAYQNAFRRGGEHLEARRLFEAHFATLLADVDIAVVSPDVGGVKRADAFRRGLSARLGREVTGGFMEKGRSGGVVSGETLVGEVRGKSVVLLDDLIGAGTTMERAARACLEAGAASCRAAATHGLFLDGAADVVVGPELDGVVVTDTVPPFRLSPEIVSRRLTVLDAASTFAEAIIRMHTGGSLVDLLGQG
jgi:ribose-phosphate pyrophosphokinase